MCEITKLTSEELQEIDKLYAKAEKIKQEALDLKNNRYEYDLCVRRSQEAFELFLKTMFKLMKEKYPTKRGGHELSKQIISIYEKFKIILNDYYVPKKDIVRIMIGSKILHSWRNVSFYGEEKLEEIGISDIFTEKEAELALDYVNKASQLCYLVRDYSYKKAGKI